MTDLSDRTELVFSGYWRVLPKDADPVETREWLQAFDAVLETEGAERAHFLLRRLLDHARARRVPLPPFLSTPYCNTVSLADQPQFPGNLEVEARLGALVRWNALAMVVRDRKSTRLNSSHMSISYAVFCLKKKKHKLQSKHNYSI